MIQLGNGVQRFLNLLETPDRLKEIQKSIEENSQKLVRTAYKLAVRTAESFMYLREQWN